MIRQSEDLPVMFCWKIFFVVKEVKRDVYIVKARFFLMRRNGLFYFMYELNILAIRLTTTKTKPWGLSLLTNVTNVLVFNGHNVLRLLEKTDNIP